MERKGVVLTGKITKAKRVWRPSAPKQLQQQPKRILK
jgi:hypothetical protein